jgi:hypothetical protein
MDPDSVPSHRISAEDGFHDCDQNRDCDQTLGNQHQRQAQHQYRHEDFEHDSQNLNSYYQMLERLRSRGWVVAVEAYCDLAFHIDSSPKVSAT